MTTTRPGRHRAPRTPLRSRLVDLLSQHGGADGHAAWITHLADRPTFEPTDRRPDVAPASADPSIPA